MSNPNPLAPQGSLLEQQAKGRSTFHVISFIGAVHVMLLCGILWTACGGGDTPKTEVKDTLGQDQTPAPDNGVFGTPPSGNIPPPPGPSSNNIPPVTGTAPAPGVYPPQTAPYTPTPPTPTPPPVTTLPSDPAPVAPVGAAAAGEYKVAKGDIGESIARKNGVSVAALVAANPGVNWNRLKVGQTIQVPGGSSVGVTPSSPSLSATGSGSGSLVYVVKAGDTGTKIAARNGVKWAEIRRANGLKSDNLRPGQKLTIPGRAAASAAPESGAPSVALPPAENLTPTAVPITAPPPR